MDLYIQTPAQAEFLSSQCDENEMIASVIVKRQYRVAGTVLVLEDEQDWSIVEPPTTEEYGAFDPEAPCAREGTDLFVLGSVYAGTSAAGPGDLTRGRFELQIDGAPHLAIDAFGARLWQRERKQLAASKPSEFTSLPLTWSGAYGGKADTETGEMPFQSNEKGIGFYVTEEQAEGSPLPYLEDPAAHISRWDERPVPIATSPLPRTSELRMTVGVHINMEGERPFVEEITQAYFNNAEPRMVLRPGASAGTHFVLNGVRPGGAPFEFTVPDCPVHAHVQLADRSYVFPAHLEQIIALPEEGRVVIGHRITYTFPFKEMERRAATLYAGEVPTELPPHYPIDWNALDEEERRSA